MCVCVCVFGDFHSLFHAQIFHFQFSLSLYVFFCFSTFFLAVLHIFRGVFVDVVSRLICVSVKNSLLTHGKMTTADTTFCLALHSPFPFIFPFPFSQNIIHLTFVIQFVCQSICLCFYGCVSWAVFVCWWVYLQNHTAPLPPDLSTILFSALHSLQLQFINTNATFVLGFVVVLKG